MRQSVIEAYPAADLAIAIVWISMMDGDDAAAAENISKSFADKRIRQFFDPGQMAGKAVAASLGAEGEVAWDTYLFYEPRLKWNGLPPAPTEYMHQLHDYAWADQAKLRTGPDLINGLHQAMEQFGRR